jgi:hypothetical protein
MATFTGTNGSDTFGRGYTTAAAAALLSGQTMNINGSSTSCSGNAATATSATSATFLNSSNYINQHGSDGSWNADFQNTPAGTTRYNGDLGANTVNGPGGSWWIQQNFRHTNSSNYWGTQVAWGWEDNANRLATRNVTGGTFGSWVYYLNSSNYTSYAPSLTGSGASGTWGIAITGNAGNTSSISNAVGGGYTWTGLQYFQSNLGASSGSLSSPPLQAYATGGNSAFFSFHRAGNFAVNMGLDSDNILRIGGWSAAADRFQMDMSGNLTMAGSVTAFSDERLKKDWAPLQEGFVAKLAKVKSGTYTRIDSDERQAGVGAQSFQPLLPETVLTDSAGTLSVAYGNAAMVSAVELAKDNVELRARIEKLEALVAKLIEGQL